MKLLIKTFGLRKALRVLKIKWIKGECRHLCSKCCWTADCFNNFE